MIEKPPIGAPCNACGLCCRAQVCSAGSYAMRLVDTYGERAPGPCPALVHDGDRQVCGVVRRPKDWLPHANGSVTALREAMLVMIGGNVGCDEAGDEPYATAQPKLAEVTGRFLARYDRDTINRAARRLFA